MPNDLHVCLDRDLPAAELPKAAKAAIAENPANKPRGTAALAGAGRPPSFMALLTGKMWKPGRTLRVRFLGGEQFLRDKVAQYARVWESFANIHLQFGDDPQAEIRVAFIAGGGSWSNIGTDALTVDADQPTMNFGWLTADTDEEEFSRVITHEFGHALGCIHEHQSPVNGIHWDKPVVYASLEAPPNKWSKEEVDVNMFQRYSESVTQHTAVDVDSIMMYTFPAEWTTDGFKAPNNTRLSATDKVYIAKMYPAAT